MKEPQSLDEFALKVAACSCRFGDYKIKFFNISGETFIAISHAEVDVDTGEKQEMLGRLWHLDKTSSRSQVVDTVFKAMRAYLEHELREKFTFMGKAIYAPHFDVDKLAAAVDFLKEERVERGVDKAIKDV